MGGGVGRWLSSWADLKIPDSPYSMHFPPLASAVKNVDYRTTIGCAHVVCTLNCMVLLVLLVVATGWVGCVVALLPTQLLQCVTQEVAVPLFLPLQGVQGLCLCRVH